MWSFSAFRRREHWSAILFHKLNSKGSESYSSSESLKPPLWFRWLIIILPSLQLNARSTRWLCVGVTALQLHKSFADPAKVTFTPSVQYLPFRLAGVVQCHIKANPPLQYVTWTKDKRLLEPYQTKDIVIMNNGSLLFTRVNQNHQGRYTCTPYNAQVWLLLYFISRLVCSTTTSSKYAKNASEPIKTAWNRLKTRTGKRF